MNQRFKILLLIKSLGLGGAERLLVDALPYLDRPRFDYHLAYLLPWKDYLVPQFREAGLAVHCLGSVNRRPPTADRRVVAAGGGWRAVGLLPLALPRLNRLQKEHQFDLIHADLPLAGVLARLVGRRHNVPVVYTEHNLQERYHPLTRSLNRLTYGWNSRVLAVSREVAESISRFGLDRGTQVATLLNGVPVEQVRAEAADPDGLREELEIPADHLVVGTVAVFRRQKRLRDWLAVARRVADRRDDVTFLLVGHGPEEASLRAEVERLGLGERVRMPGFRPDGRRLLGLLDLYLMSSEFEGLPIALLEALALGKTAVATPAGGIPELVSHGQEGFLAPVGAVDELAGYTLKLLDEEQLRLQMGQRGAEKVAARFHLQKRVQRIEALYLELLSPAQIEPVSPAGSNDDSITR